MRALAFAAIAFVTATSTSCEALSPVECEVDRPSDKDESIVFWRMLAIKARPDLVFGNRSSSKDDAGIKLRAQRWVLRIDGDRVARLKSMSTLGVSFVVAYDAPPRIIVVDVTDRAVVQRREPSVFDKKAEYINCEESDFALLQDAGFSAEDAYVFRVLPLELVELLSRREFEHARRAGKGDKRLIDRTVFRVVPAVPVARVEVDEQSYR